MRARWSAIGMASLVAAAGCGSHGDPASPEGDAGSGSGQGSGVLTVFAAASLRAPFTEIGARFEAGHRGSTVRFNFAGSSDLLAQLRQGAPADVFATADTPTMARATADGLVDGKPVNFAANTLQIAVPPGNPARIGAFADLARPGVRLVVCAPEVPCGSATEKLQAATGTALRPVSEESSVADVIGKVATGEADAGLAYVTDVKAARDRVEGVPLPEAAAIINTYPVAALKDSTNRALANDFVSFVTSAEGQAVLRSAGFARPGLSR